mmetsp:Transcript_10264/g.29315  ORF Transcript_10264/g.29315 Transcript_10264/m.29315 type:complete len:204 (+) Transcript_10264:407-1018(+)
MIISQQKYTKNTFSQMFIGSCKAVIGGYVSIIMMMILPAMTNMMLLMNRSLKATAWQILTIRQSYQRASSGPGPCMKSRSPSSMFDFDGCEVGSASKDSRWLLVPDFTSTSSLFTGDSCEASSTASSALSSLDLLRNSTKFITVVSPSGSVSWRLSLGPSMCSAALAFAAAWATSPWSSRASSTTANATLSMKKDVAGINVKK